MQKDLEASLLVVLSCGGKKYMHSNHEGVKVR